MKLLMFTFFFFIFYGCDALLPQSQNPEDCVSNPDLCASRGNGLVCDVMLHTCQPLDAYCMSSSNCPSAINAACTNNKCAPCNLDIQCVNWSKARNQIVLTSYCTNGLCGECRNNADCLKSPASICDGIVFYCRGCKLDPECQARNSLAPYCDQNTGICSECKVATDCKIPGKPFCNAGSCVGCNASSDCKMKTNPICDVSNPMMNYCRKCSSDNECMTKLNDPCAQCSLSGSTAGSCQ